MAAPPSNGPAVDAAGAPAQRPVERPAFQNLPLSLSARLASGRVRVRALRAVHAGAIVPLDTPVGEPSRLIAEGSVIAAGEIVEIQGHLALRLTRLGSDDE